MFDQNIDSIKASYDEVPYESLPIADTHPNRLGTLSHLFSLKSAPPERCRVLELGCSMGGNIIPLAGYLPASEFVGVDLSDVQINIGKKLVEAASMTNIKLLHLSILDINRDLGEFDYIIAHGVFSWIPAAVREKLLEVCSTNLAPEGVAYVSFNTYPGWHMRGMIRSMMRYHANRFGTPQERITQARGLLDFLAQAVPTENNAYGILLQKEVTQLRNSPDYYLYHEHLEEVNDPVYFHEFMEAAERHNLQYLTDMEFSRTLLSNYPPQIANTLAQLGGNIVEVEQYLDFIRNRQFRRVLLAHKNAAIVRTIDPARIRNLFISTEARAVSVKPNITDPTVAEQYRTDKGSSASTNNPITKAALAVLAEQARKPIHFDVLLREAHKKLGRSQSVEQESVDPEAKTLTEELLNGFATELLTFHIHVPNVDTQISSHPRVASFVRAQAQQQSWVTNAAHAKVNIDDFGRHLITFLDGTRDKGALLKEMMDLNERGTLPYVVNGEKVTEKKVIREAIQSGLNNTLRQFRDFWLLLR